jgi:hypothetical protein
MSSNVRSGHTVMERSHLTKPYPMYGAKWPIGLRYTLMPYRSSSLEIWRQLFDVYEPATLNDSNDQLPIWIDAVCIDQENIDERTKQVRRMRSIYRDAERVVIWLGGFNEPSDKDVENTLDMLGVGKGDHEGMPAAALAVMAFIADRNNTVSDYDLFFRTDPGNNIVAWAEIQKLFNRPWFKRLWIIQELNVSRHAIVLWIELSYLGMSSTPRPPILLIPPLQSERKSSEFFLGWGQIMVSE